jgi:hypothetical protein
MRCNRLSMVEITSGALDKRQSLMLKRQRQTGSAAAKCSNRSARHRLYMTTKNPLTCANDPYRPTWLLDGKEMIKVRFRHVRQTLPGCAVLDQGGAATRLLTPSQGRRRLAGPDEREPGSAYHKGEPCALSCSASSWRSSHPRPWPLLYSPLRRGRVRPDPAGRRFRVRIRSHRPASCSGCLVPACRCAWPSAPTSTRRVQG